MYYTHTHTHTHRQCLAWSTQGLSASGRLSFTRFTTIVTRINGESSTQTRCMGECVCVCVCVWLRGCVIFFHTHTHTHTHTPTSTSTSTHSRLLPPVVLEVPTNTTGAGNSNGDGTIVSELLHSVCSNCDKRGNIFRRVRCGRAFTQATEWTDYIRVGGSRCGRGVLRVLCLSTLSV